MGEERYAVVKEFKSPYDQAHECVDRFEKWHSGAKVEPSSREIYEKRLPIKMSMKEWIKLHRHLHIFETDEKSKFSYVLLKRYY